jgi:hypothetical protein
MALLTVADVATAAGLTITTGSAEEDQCQFFCDTIESYLTELIGVLFTSQTVVGRLQADYDGIITLPFRPVTSITSVETIDGDTRSNWQWNGIDEIDHLEAHEVVDITYVAGYSAAPAVLKNIAISAASRLMINPTGVRQQTVGAISETIAAGEGTAGSVWFTAQEKELLARYQTTMGTLRLGPRDSLWRATLPIL